MYSLFFINNKMTIQRIQSQSRLVIARGITNIPSLPLSFSLIADPERNTQTFDLIYDKPWTRIGPYIIGMIVGFTLHK